jgi:hypothetical protein
MWRRYLAALMVAAAATGIRTATAGGAELLGEITVGARSVGALGPLDATTACTCGQAGSGSQSLRRDSRGNLNSFADHWLFVVGEEDDLTPYDGEGCECTALVVTVEACTVSTGDGTTQAPCSQADKDALLITVAASEPDVAAAEAALMSGSWSLQSAKAYASTPEYRVRERKPTLVDQACMGREEIPRTCRLQGSQNMRVCTGGYTSCEQGYGPMVVEMPLEESGPFCTDPLECVEELDLCNDDSAGAPVAPADVACDSEASTPAGDPGLAAACGPGRPETSGNTCDGDVGSSSCSYCLASAGPGLPRTNRLSNVCPTPPCVELQRGDDAVLFHSSAAGFPDDGPLFVNVDRFESTPYITASLNAVATGLPEGSTVCATGKTACPGHGAGSTWVDTSLACQEGLPPEPAEICLDSNQRRSEPIGRLGWTDLRDGSFDGFDQGPASSYRTWTSVDSPIQPRDGLYPEGKSSLFQYDRLEVQGRNGE